MGGVVQTSVALFKESDTVRAFVNGNPNRFEGSAFCAGITDFGTTNEDRIVDIKHIGEGSKIGIFKVEKENISVNNEETQESIVISNKKIEDIAPNTHSASRSESAPIILFNRNLEAMLSNGGMDEGGYSKQEEFNQTTDELLFQKNHSMNVPASGTYMIKVNHLLKAINEGYVSAGSISNSKSLSTVKSFVDYRVEVRIVNNEKVLKDYKKDFYTNVDIYSTNSTYSMNDNKEDRYAESFLQELDSGDLKIEMNYYMDGGSRVLCRADIYYDGQGNDTSVHTKNTLRLTLEEFSISMTGIDNLSVLSPNGQYFGIDANNYYKLYRKDGVSMLQYKGVIKKDSNIPYLIAGGEVSGDGMISTYIGTQCSIGKSSGRYKIGHTLLAANYIVHVTPIGVTAYQISYEKFDNYILVYTGGDYRPFSFMIYGVY